MFLLGFISTCSPISNIFNYTDGYFLELRNAMRSDAAAVLLISRPTTKPSLIFRSDFMMDCWLSSEEQVIFSYSFPKVKLNSWTFDILSIRSER